MAEALRSAPVAPISVSGAHFAIVEARFYDSIGVMLFAGAERALRSAGATFEHIRVPGALEIPIAAAIALDSADRHGRTIDGVVALGCVIRGETFHFEIVATESARALMDLAVKRGVPLGNSILTMNTLEQAQVRADPEKGDKGGEAARAAISLVALKRSLAST